MLVQGYVSPAIPRSSDLAKINHTYKSSTCPVLLFSGNAWGEYRSVSINWSSETQINEWSRSERGIVALFTHTPRIYSSPHSCHIFFILHLVKACCRSVKCKLEYNIRFLKKQHILTGEMLDLLPSVLVVLLINFKFYMLPATIFQSRSCHKSFKLLSYWRDIRCFQILVT